MTNDEQRRFELDLEDEEWWASEQNATKNTHIMQTYLPFSIHVNFAILLAPTP